MGWPTRIAHASMPESAQVGRGLADSLSRIEGDMREALLYAVHEDDGAEAESIEKLHAGHTTRTENHRVGLSREMLHQSQLIIGVLIRVDNQQRATSGSRGGLRSLTIPGKNGFSRSGTTMPQVAVRPVINVRAAWFGHVAQLVGQRDHSCASVRADHVGTVQGAGHRGDRDSESASELFRVTAKFLPPDPDDAAID